MHPSSSLSVYCRLQNQKFHAEKRNQDRENQRQGYASPYKHIWVVYLGNYRREYYVILVCCKRMAIDDCCPNLLYLLGDNLYHLIYLPDNLEFDTIPTWIL